MKKLTGIRLINWHYLVDQTLDVEGSLYLFGKNESGKSSVLDAIQFVLVGDLRRVRFNASAQEEGRSGRDLAGYCLCKVGEEYQRAEATAYVALQFADADDSPFLVGAVVDAHSDGREDHAFFIINDQALADPLFLGADRRPYSRREFQARMRGHPSARLYPATEEYQDALRNRLGQLNERFFDLFAKAFAFRPVGNIRDFVYSYVLDKEPLDVGAMRRTREEMERLSKIAARVEAQIGALRAMMQADERRATLMRTLRLHDYLVRSAEREQALTTWDAYERRQGALSEQLAALADQISGTEAQVREAQAQLDEAQAALGQDARYVQRQAWEREAERLRQEVARARDRRATLLQQLAAERRRLDSVLALAGSLLLEEVHLGTLRTFVAWLDRLPEALVDVAGALAQTGASREALHALNDRAREERARLAERARQWRQEAAEIDARLRELRQGGRLAVPREAQALRELLAPLLGEPPRYLCELLEVPDEAWQNAVEGLLGRRRFDLLVPPQRFEACLDAYEREGRPRGIHGVRLVDVARVLAEGRRAQPGSLAAQVTAEDPAARAYVDHLLGDCQICDTVAGLRRHRRAVTPTCMSYSQYAVDHLDPAVYRDWFIGQRARGRQIERLEAELERLGRELAALNEPLQRWDECIRATTPGDVYARWLTTDLPNLPALAAAEAAKAEVERQLAATDWADLEAQQAQVEALRERREQLQQVLYCLNGERGRLEQSQRTGRQEAEVLQVRLAEAEARVMDLEAAAPAEWLGESQARYQEVRRQYTPERLIEVYTRQRQGIETQLTNVAENIRESQLGYQRAYDFWAPINPDEVGPYRTELERLEATELPQRRQEIERARGDAEIEFREHFIHRLREQILQAQKRLEQMNEALKQVRFSGTRYRFVHQPHPRYESYYNLIVRQSSEMLGMALLEGVFYEQHRAVIDEIFEKLTAPGAAASAAEVEELCDHRNYLTYDIELIQDDGRRELFSKVGRSQSGGKTQAPYYVAMVAAFADLYRVADARRNDTVRLIVFDEAFNRMDRENTQSALELMKRYQLQVITATPPKRFDEIVPYVETSALLARSGERVVVTPYYYRGDGQR